MRRVEPQTKAGLIKLLTPEGVPVSLELAGRGERAIAFVLDLVIIVCCMIAWGFVCANLTRTFFLMILGLFILRSGYFILFELAWQGATPGKRMLGIRVAARDGGVLLVDRIFARNMVREVELFLPLAALFSPEMFVGRSTPWLWIPACSWVIIFLFFPFFNRERKRTGDLIAGTVVIQVPKVHLQKDFGAHTKELKFVFSEAQLAIYGERELETLAAILRTLDNRKVPRRELFLVAQTITKKIGYPGKAWQEDVPLFLKEFYAAQRSALERRLLFGKRKADKHDRVNAR